MTQQGLKRRHIRHGTDTIGMKMMPVLLGRV